MTKGAMENFKILTNDYLSNLNFFLSQEKDPYTTEVLEDLITYVYRYKNVMQETVDNPA